MKTYCTGDGTAVNSLFREQEGTAPPRGAKRLTLFADASPCFPSQLKGYHHNHYHYHNHCHHHTASLAFTICIKKLVTFNVFCCE